MKKILTLTAVGAILTVPAMAVVQCVGLAAGTECRSGMGGENSIIGWRATCNYDTSNEISVKGIGVCAQDQGYGRFDVLSDEELFVVSADATSVNLTACWCRVLTPFLSKWMLNHTFTDSLSCAKYCAQRCASGLEMESLMDEILVDAI
ncbi:MAG: hypothetical protein E7009_01740 [Alphaproteobacteria bacterium]|nr:hypothetical protein [Alphaproteobacteria bacterium]